MDIVVSPWFLNRANSSEWHTRTWAKEQASASPASFSSASRMENLEKERWVTLGRVEAVMFTVSIFLFIFRIIFVDSLLGKWP